MQSKVDEEVRTYFKLGELLASIGDHKESERFYARIIRKQTSQNVIRDEDLFPLWGREMFYLIDDPLKVNAARRHEARDYSELEIFSLRELADKKKMNSTLALLRDVYKLCRKGRGKGRMKVFENLRAEHLSTQQIISNGILSLLDLGFLYSIIALAYSDRETLKQDVKWSSKIEIAYLQADYRKLFGDLNREYENYGRFNPTIRFVYEDCREEIVKKVLSEIFNAYQMISVAKVQELTDIGSAAVSNFLKENPNLPYLFDPITQSVVYYQKTVPLYR
jgi:hypothetical protein